MHNPFDTNLALLNSLKEQFECANCVNESSEAVVSELIEILIKINTTNSELFDTESINRILRNE